MVTIVGREVGDIFGTMEGSELGIMLGTDDGLMLGVMVGIVDGTEEGRIVGTTLGFDGKLVGAKVGTEEGEVVVYTGVPNCKYKPAEFKPGPPLTTVTDNTKVEAKPLTRLKEVSVL